MAGRVTTTHLNGTSVKVNVTFDGTPTDIDGDVIAVTIRRGRSRQLDQMTAGSCNITVRNDARTFDPLNTASATGSTSRPRMPMYVEVAGTRVFTGYVNDISIDWDRTDIGTVTYSCIDGFSVLANQAMTAHTATQQLSGARVTAVLDRSEVDWSATARAIDPGQSTLQADSVPASTNVLNYLHRVAQSEQGRMFIAADGDLAFHDRLSVINPTPSIQLFDTEAGAGGSNPTYQTFRQDYGTDLLYNRIETQIIGGTLQTASDATAQAEYLIRTLSLTELLLLNDAAAADLGDYLLNRYKNPDLRVREISTTIQANVAKWTQLLGVELGDVLQVTKTFATGTPTSVVESCVVEQIGHSITPERHTITFGFGSVDEFSYLTLDDPLLGQLDNNALAF